MLLAMYGLYCVGVFYLVLKPKRMRRVLLAEFLGHGVGGLPSMHRVYKCIDTKMGLQYIERSEELIHESVWIGRGWGAWSSKVSERVGQLMAKRVDYSLLAFIEG